jgi:hypothetical protein
LVNALEHEEQQFVLRDAMLRVGGCFDAHSSSSTASENLG